MQEIDDANLGSSEERSTEDGAIVPSEVRSPRRRARLQRSNRLGLEGASAIEDSALEEGDTSVQVMSRRDRLEYEMYQTSDSGKRKCLQREIDELK